MRRDIVLALSVRLSVRHFCVRSHILEVLWRISLKLRMSIYMHKRMIHAKWHFTPSVKTRVMALCFLKKSVSLFIRPICIHPQTKHMLRGISILRICLLKCFLNVCLKTKNSIHFFVFTPNVKATLLLNCLICMV